MPGKPNLGVFKFKERYIVFSDENSISQFLASPETYLQKIISHICRSNPELIHLLKLQEDFPDASLTALLQGKDGMHPLFSISPLMVNKAIETPTHFTEKHISPDYHWNEWELRKKALQMANIRNKQTVGSQTLLSNFRRENDTQTRLPKDEMTNTGKSVGVQIRDERKWRGIEVGSKKM